MGWKNLGKKKKRHLKEQKKKRKNGWTAVKNTSTQNTQFSFYTFLIQRPFRFTPLLTLRSLIFGLTPFWLVSSHLC